MGVFHVFFSSFFLQIEDLSNGVCLDAMSKSGHAGVRLCHGLGGYQVRLCKKVVLKLAGF